MKIKKHMVINSFAGGAGVATLMMLLGSTNQKYSVSAEEEESIVTMPIMDSMEDSMAMDSSFDQWLEQFDHPTADPDFWGEHPEESIDAVHEEIENTVNSPYDQFKDFTQEDLTFGYDEEYYNQFKGMSEDEILASNPDLHPQDAWEITSLIDSKSKLELINEAAQSDHRMLKSKKNNKAIHFSPTSDNSCQTTQTANDFAELQTHFNTPNVDCIQLVEGNTYDWPTDGTGTLVLEAGRHISIYVNKNSVERSTKYSVKNNKNDNKDKLFAERHNLPTTTFQGCVNSDTCPPMFFNKGGTLSVSDVIVRRSNGNVLPAGVDGITFKKKNRELGQQGGFIFALMGGVKVVNCQFFFFGNDDTESPFTLKDLKNLDWKQRRAEMKDYNKQYMEEWKKIDKKGRTKEEKIAAPFHVTGGNIYIATGTLEVVKCGFSFWTPEFLKAIPDPIASAAAPSISRLDITGGYLYVGKGQLRTKLTKFTEYIPLRHFLKTKSILLIKLRGVLNAVTSGTLKKELTCVFVNQQGFPNQVLTGTGFLYYVGTGNAIITGASLQYNSITPTWIGLGGAVFNGAGNIILTGVFFNFNEVASTYIGLGKLIFNGAGTLIMTGCPALANYVVDTTISGGYFTVAAGVNINTGNAAEIFSVWSYRLVVGHAYFTGSGHYLLLGSPSLFSNGAIAVRGTGDYAFQGAGGMSIIGSPINDFSASKWVFGYGMYAGVGAGLLMQTGCPVHEFAAFKGCFGVGCILANGAGVIRLQFNSVQLNHGVDFTYGLGQVVFLGVGLASTYQIDVQQNYGYQAVNDGNPGVFVGQTYLQEQFETVMGRLQQTGALQATASTPQGLASRTEEVLNRQGLVARATTISMAGEDVIEMEININEDIESVEECSICGSDITNVAGENSCSVSETCEEAIDTELEPEEIILFVGELAVTCTTLKSIPEYPSKPADDADTEEWTSYRTQKSAYKRDMRNNVYGCASPQLIKQMFIEEGINADLLTVSKKTTATDDEASVCETTETYLIAAQSNDYFNALELEAAFNTIANSDLTDIVTKTSIMDAQSNICTASIVDDKVNMNVIRAPAPSVEIVQGEFARGNSIDLEWSFDHEDGLSKVNIELIRLREDRGDEIFENNWILGERYSSDSRTILKTKDFSGTVTYTIPEELAGGEYVFRVTGISKIGTEISGNSELFQLGYPPRSVDVIMPVSSADTDTDTAAISSIQSGEEIVIPYNGFDKNVKITLQKKDPVTEAMEKIAVIKQSARGYKGSSKPITWTIPRDIEGGDNYVIVVSPKNQKNRKDVNPTQAISQPFSINV